MTRFVRLDSVHLLSSSLLPLRSLATPALCVQLDSTRIDSLVGRKESRGDVQARGWSSPAWPASFKEYCYQASISPNPAAFMIQRVVEKPTACSITGRGAATTCTRLFRRGGVGEAKARIPPESWARLEDAPTQAGGPALVGLRKAGLGCHLPALEF